MENFTCADCLLFIKIIGTDFGCCKKHEPFYGNDTVFMRYNNESCEYLEHRTRQKTVLEEFYSD